VGVRARFRLIGGIDIDPEACADFEYLTGSPSLCADVAKLTPDALRAFAGERAPDCVFSSPPCTGYTTLIDDTKKLNGLRRGIEQWEPDLVFIEPFRSLWAGEENSATEMQVVADALVGIATDYNCGVWFAHHEKKGGFGEDDKMSAARGSTVLEGVVTVMENFGSVKNDELRELSYSKSRYEVPPPPCRLDWDQEHKWYTHIPSDQIEDEIILALQENNDEPMTVTELSDVNGETKRKLNETLKKMVKDGKVKKLAGVSYGGDEGSSGPRYRLAKGEDSGALDF
jgi:hypothetical protein